MIASRAVPVTVVAIALALVTVSACSKTQDAATPPASSASTGSVPGTTPTTPVVKTPGTTATTENGTTVRTPGSAPTTGGTTGTAPATAPNQVTISEFLFAPDTLTVPAGTEVVWVNDDDFDHYIVSEDKTTLDSDPFGKGATYSHTFATPGTYKYYCNIHNQMKGTIVVT